jgi:hypothetical protein
MGKKPVSGITRPGVRDPVAAIAVLEPTILSELKPAGR